MRPIDFDKQPHCKDCGFCIGWAYDKQWCSANVAYREDGSCAAYADYAMQMRLDSYEYPEDNEPDYDTDYESEEDEEYEN